MTGGDRLAATTAERILSTMAKKAELLEEAAKLKIEVPAKATIADIEALIAGAKPEKREKVEKEIVAERDAEVAKAGKRSEKALKESEEKNGSTSNALPVLIERSIFCSPNFSFKAMSKLILSLKDNVSLMINKSMSPTFFKGSVLDP